MSTKKHKTAHGLGARYGRTVRKRRAEIEVNLRKKYYCQKCGAKAIKRVSVGVWRCSKCELIISGGAYTLSTKIGDEAKRSVETTTIE